MRAISTTATQCRCDDCYGLMTLGFPAMVSMEEYLEAMEAIRCPHCGSRKVLIGQSRSWTEDKALMTVPPIDLIERRAADWLSNGEIGNSALVIHAFMLKGHRGGTSHPHDVSDLRRCLLLLRRIPEWSARMEEMAVLSPEWSRLSTAWHDLTLSFTRETGPNWQRVRARKTDEMLKALIGDI